MKSDKDYKKPKDRRFWPYRYGYWCHAWWWYL